MAATPVATASPLPACRSRHRWIPWQGADGQSPDGRNEAPLIAPALSCLPERGSTCNNNRSQALDGIAVTDVTRSFLIGGQRITALADLSLHVPAGSIVAVIGPNGSGKSTLLRLIGGLLEPDRGEVRVWDEPVDGPPQKVGICFQEPRLLPWRSVFDNVGLPLELAGAPKVERRTRTQAAIEFVGLRGFEGARPYQLSGGMRQRAAVARALVREPSVLLLDEPFSALDALTRERLDREVLDLWHRTGMTILLVTHDIGEALMLADRVLVLSARPGRVVADIPVAVARPRDRAGAADHAADLAELASEIRSHLAETDHLEAAA